MPSDEELSQELISSFDEVRRFFLEFPDFRAIRLLMNSFGQGDGAGVYQLVEDCFKLYPAAAVVDELILSLNSDYASVRYWSTQVSQLYVDCRLIEPLFKNITTVVDCDLLEATLASLVNYDSPLVRKRLSEIVPPIRNEDFERLVSAYFEPTSR